jgi:hypothetical protein
MWNIGGVPYSKDIHSKSAFRSLYVRLHVELLVEESVAGKSEVLSHATTPHN